jgi:hypothetical protein
LEQIELLKQARSRDLEKIRKVTQEAAAIRNMQLKLEVPQFKEDLKEFENLLKFLIMNNKDVQSD